MNTKQISLIIQEKTGTVVKFPFMQVILLGPLRHRHWKHGYYLKKKKKGMVKTMVIMNPEMKALYLKSKSKKELLKNRK